MILTGAAGPVATISFMFTAGSATAALSVAADGTGVVPSAAEPVQSYIIRKYKTQTRNTQEINTICWHVLVVIVAPELSPELSCTGA